MRSQDHAPSAGAAARDRSLAPRERKWLGKITTAQFGFGGYDGAMIGFTVVITGDYGVHDFTGTWTTRPERAEWSIEDQRSHFADAVTKLCDTLRAAKMTHVAQLVGTPVEVTSDGTRMRSWRVLTEVL